MRVLKGGVVKNNGKTKNITPYLLDESDINLYLGDRLGDHYVGCFSKDRLPEYLGKFIDNGYCVMNMDKPQGGGTHWVALGFKNKKWYYYDSIGLNPPLVVIRNCKPLMKNYERHQLPYLTNCGLWTIKFCLDMFKE